MDDFIKVIKVDSKVQIKIKGILGKCNRLPYNYQSEIGFDTLIQNVILEESITIVCATRTDKDIELKMKFSRIKNLECSKKIIIKMEDCDIFLSKIKNKNKKKHCLTKKYIYFSNLIINKYIVRNAEIDVFKDILQS